MCTRPSEREVEKLAVAKVTKSLRNKLRIVECECAGLSESDYNFINKELSNHCPPDVVMTEAEKITLWRGIAPKLAKILKTGKKRFNWPDLPDHFELILDEVSHDR